MGRINSYTVANHNNISDDDYFVIDGNTNGTRSVNAKAFSKASLFAEHPNVEDSADCNLNNYKTQGLYYFSSNGQHSNFPDACVNGWLEVLTAGASGQRVKQLFYNFGTVTGTGHDDFKTYVRTAQYEDSTWTWSPWTPYMGEAAESAILAARSSIVVNSGNQAQDFNDELYLTRGLRYFLTSDSHTNLPYGVKNGWIETLTAGNHGESIRQIIYPKTDFSGLVYERIVNLNKVGDSWDDAVPTFHEWKASNGVSVASNLHEAYAVKTFIDRTKVKPVDKFTKVLLLGDSIAAGSYSDIDPNNSTRDVSVSASHTYGWAYRFKELTGCSLTNVAIPGAMLSSIDNSASDPYPYYYMLRYQYANTDGGYKLNPADYDLILIAIGTNDAGFDAPMYDIKYELNRLLTWLDGIGNADTAVVFITPIRRIQRAKTVTGGTIDRRLIDYSTPQNRKIAEVSAVLSNAALHKGYSIINGYDIPLVMGTALGKDEDVLIPDTSYRNHGTYYNQGYPWDQYGHQFEDSGHLIKIDYESDPAKAMSSDTIHPSKDGHLTFAKYIRYILNATDSTVPVVKSRDGRDSRNLDDYTTTGTWYFTVNDGHGDPDQNFPPRGTKNGWLQVYGGSGDAVKQVFYRMGTTAGDNRNDLQTYIRTKDPSTHEWSVWTDIHDPVQVEASALVVSMEPVYDSDDELEGYLADRSFLEIWEAIENGCVAVGKLIDGDVSSGNYVYGLLTTARWSTNQSTGVTVRFIDALFITDIDQYGEFYRINLESSENEDRSGHAYFSVYANDTITFYTKDQTDQKLADKADVENGAVYVGAPEHYSGSDHHMTGTYQLVGEYCTITATAKVMAGWQYTFYRLPEAPLSNVMQFIFVGDVEYAIKTDVHDGQNCVNIYRVDGNYQAQGDVDVPFTITYRYSDQYSMHQNYTQAEVDAMMINHDHAIENLLADI